MRDTKWYLVAIIAAVIVLLAVYLAPVFAEPPIQVELPARAAPPKKQVKVMLTLWLTQIAKEKAEFQRAHNCKDVEEERFPFHSGQIVVSFVCRK